MTSVPDAGVELLGNPGTDVVSFEYFDALYRALTSHDGACLWQHRLFAELEAGRFPTDVELATGLGKTSIIALWVLALGRALARSSQIVPRRLAYIVDRRVVVDQASEFAEHVCKRLEQAASDPRDALYGIALTLKNAGCTSSVIELSTLRGQRALDTRWRDDPTRPAIIVGTVDMIGSRLLFSAFGRVGPWGRPLEAALVGQDCLLVLDEAHLSSPFAATLSAVEQCTGTLAPFSVVRMGATMEPVRHLLRRTPGLCAVPTIRRVFQLLDSDTVIDGHTWPAETTEKKVSDRIDAKKRIEIEHRDSERGVGVQLAAWAVDKLKVDKSAAIGIVLNTVAEVRRCAAALRECGISDDRIVTLTGSMRGWDRDMVVESERYARFISQRDRSGLGGSAMFLVATSCVEVGADIDCDHLGVEACELDSLIQRLGRVNRLGASTSDVSVRVVGDSHGTNPAGQVFRRLLTLLAHGNVLQGSPSTFTIHFRDADPEAVGSALANTHPEHGAKSGSSLKTEERSLLEVRIPPPALTAVVLDDLAMTSKHPDSGARPDVGRWLHGSIEDASLYVELAWRLELDRVTEPECAARLLTAFPVGARETARCPLYEAVELLKSIARRAVEEESLGECILLVTQYGSTTSLRLCDVPTEDDGRLRALLHDAMIVLPSRAGGYDGQFVSAASQQSVTDIAEESQASNRAQRRRLWIESGRVSAFSTNSKAEPLCIDVDTDQEGLLDAVEDVAAALLGAGWRLVEAAGNGASGVVVAREDRRALEDAEADEASLGFHTEVLLSQHLRDARAKAEQLCNRLALSDELRQTVIEAAGRHDLGKDRPWWQRAVGRMSQPPIAKSGRSQFDHIINRGYRHELGSVADLEEAYLPEPVDRELCLHLVAAHHGHARPGFRAEAAGPFQSDAIKRSLNETPTRFARLQAKYGWWGLAWLEALVKAADVLASRDEEGAP